MDRRSKHLSSEERGVIFAEQSRGSNQGVSVGFLGTPPARSAGNWPDCWPMDPIASRWPGACMTNAMPTRSQAGRGQDSLRRSLQDKWKSRRAVLESFTHQMKRLTAALRKSTTYNRRVLRRPATQIWRGT